MVAPKYRSEVRLAPFSSVVTDLSSSYFQTNGFDGNQLVASYILPDGTLVAGSAIWTQGNGSAGINDPNPYENHVSCVLSVLDRPAHGSPIRFTAVAPS